MQVQVPDSEIIKCGTDKDAMQMSLHFSKSNATALAIDLGYSLGQLSKMLSNSYGERLPRDRTVDFVVAVENTIYLRWLYLRSEQLRPGLLDPRNTPADRLGIDADMLDLRLLLKEAIDLIKQARPAGCQQCRDASAMFALTAIPGNVSRQLLEEVLWIEYEMGGQP